jgi:hypothetical protein
VLLLDLELDGLPGLLLHQEVLERSGVVVVDVERPPEVLLQLVDGLVLVRGGNPLGPVGVLGCRRRDRLDADLVGVGAEEGAGGRGQPTGGPGCVVDVAGLRYVELRGVVVVRLGELGPGGKGEGQGGGEQPHHRDCGAQPEPPAGRSLEEHAVTFRECPATSGEGRIRGEGDTRAL